MASILTFRRLVWNVLCAYFLLQKKEIQDPNCPNLDTKKLQLPPLSNTWPLRKHFNQVYYVEECFFLRKKIDRFWADTANTDIHNLAYLQNLWQRPAFRATPTQSRKVVSRPVNTKDCVTMIFLFHVTRTKPNLLKTNLFSTNLVWFL